MESAHVRHSSQFHQALIVSLRPQHVPERPLLFLIDGNSQMYRAYHAIRGLDGS